MSEERPPYSPPVDRDVIGGMLQSLEHLIDTTDRVSVFAGQLVNAQKTGKPLSPQTLAHYEQQLAELDTQRARMKRPDRSLVDAHRARALAG